MNTNIQSVVCLFNGSYLIKNEFWLESIISSTTLKDIQCLYILVAFDFFHFACSDIARDGEL